MTYKAILFEKKDHLAHITLNRPEIGNAMNDELIYDLEAAMIECDEDAEVRAVLLSGAGKTFCVGGDLKYFAKHADVMPKEIKRVIVHLHNAVSRMARMDAPVVAAVHGNVAGAGVSLLAGVDIAVVSESSTFTMAYTSVGLSPDGSSTYYLPRVIGMRRALDAMLTNERISSAEALEWGLVSRVVGDDVLMEQATALATQLSQGPTKALGAAKRLLRGSLNETLEAQMEYEAQAISQMAGTEDFKEGVAAFLEKREPEFKGK